MGQLLKSGSYSEPKINSDLENTDNIRKKMSKFMYTASLIVGLALLLFTYYLEALGLGVIRFLSTALGLGIMFTATKCYKKNK